MSKVALSLAFLSALAAGASAQSTYYPVPFTTASAYLDWSYNGSPRHFKLQVDDLDSLPPALVTWFNTTYAPYWGMGTDFTSVPEFMSSKLKINDAASPHGIRLYGPIPTVGNVKFEFEGRWDTYPELHSSLSHYNPSGAGFWVVVVKQDNAGNYSLLNATVGPSSPSYYDITPGGRNDQYTDGPRTGLTYAKYLYIAEGMSAVSTVPVVNKYYVLLCSFQNNSPYISITVRDALLQTFTSSGYPIP